MYRSASVAIVQPTDTARVHMGGRGDIPIISFGRDASESFQITLNSTLLSPAEQVAWLRTFAGQVEDLAEQVEQLHGAAAVAQ